MVCCPEEARLEIVVEDSVTSSELILRAEDNLDKYHSQEMVEMLKRNMMRKVSAQYREQTPTVAELQQKVALFQRSKADSREGGRRRPRRSAGQYGEPCSSSCAVGR